MSAVVFLKKKIKVFESPAARGVWTVSDCFSSDFNYLVIMKRFVAVHVLSLFTIACLAQVPMVRQKTWSIKAGSDINFPLTRHYFDFSVVKGADYYWEYQAHPKMGFGYFAEVALVKNFRMKKAMGFITYGLSYKQTVRQMKYSGWEGGGVSGGYVYNSGEGLKKWTDHYAGFSAKITQQFYIGARKQLLLNSLGLSANFKVYEVESRKFTGNTTYTNGTVLSNALGYTEQRVNDEFYIPQLHLNYEFGYVIYAGNSAIIPNITVPVLNFNNYLQKYEPRNTPLKLRREYFKEVIVGITWMPGVQR